MPFNQSILLKLEKIVGGGQAMGTLDDGRKAFVWGGLPGETVSIRITKKKNKLVEGVVEDVIHASDERILPLDTESYLSTSPWQIMTFDAEQSYKAKLVQEAFELHGIHLDATPIYSDDCTANYRNKVEFSWYGHVDEDGNEMLDLAFFRRGSKGKIPVLTSSLLPESMIQLASQVRDVLHAKSISARSLKTLLIRCNQGGECVWQLYVKDEDAYISSAEAAAFSALGGEVIYSDPRSPASRITKRLAQFGNIVLEDTLLGTSFRYATEGFFQVNLPVYEHVLREMQQWIPAQTPTVDIYSGVGTIGLTIGGSDCTLVEVDANAVREMKRNVAELGKANEAKPVLAASENALEYITGDRTIIVDPPRAGLHQAVIDRLLSEKPNRIVYLSCNPVTQARDVALLQQAYRIVHHQGYNFFPRTPHIEHLVVLDV